MAKRFAGMPKPYHHGTGIPSMAGAGNIQEDEENFGYHALQYGRVATVMPRGRTGTRLSRRVS